MASGSILSRRGNAIRPLGQSARSLDAAVRFLAEPLRPEPFAAWLSVRCSRPRARRPGVGRLGRQARPGPATCRSGQVYGSRRRPVPPAPGPITGAASAPPNADRQRREGRHLGGFRHLWQGHPARYAAGGRAQAGIYKQSQVDARTCACQLDSPSRPAFVRPQAGGSDKSRGIAYNAAADRRSWEAMKAVFPRNLRGPVTQVTTISPAAASRSPRPRSGRGPCRR